MAFTNALLMPYAVTGLGAGTLEAHSLKGDNSTLYKHGMLLRKLTDGTVIPCVTSEDDGVHYTYAGPDLTAATADFIKVWRIDEDSRFICQLHHGTAASAVPAQAQIGDRYDVEIAATSYIWGVDLEATNDPVLEITNIIPNLYPYEASRIDAEGTITDPESADDFGLVEVKIIASQLNLAPAAS